MASGRENFKKKRELTKPPLKVVLAAGIRRDKEKSEVPIQKLVDLEELFVIFIRILLVFDRTQISEKRKYPNRNNSIWLWFL